MARKKNPTYRKSPAQWFTDSVRAERQALFVDGDVDEIGAALVYQKRALEKDYLIESIKLLRKHVEGFDAADGYDLHRVAFLPKDREEKIRMYAPIIREEMASPHVLVRPRSKASRKALELHTGQTLVPHRKSYAVHVPKPERTKVTIKGGKFKSVEVSETIRGRVYHDRFFLIGNYLTYEKVKTDKRGRVTRKTVTDPPPMTFEDIIRIARRMLPHMPNGYYVVETSNHGSIAQSIPRSLLIERLASRFLGYDTFRGAGKDSRGLAETVTGFRLVSSNAQGAAREYNERETRRGVLRKARAAERIKQRRKVIRRLGRLV